MGKKYKLPEENDKREKLGESDIPYQRKLDQSIQQAEEGKTIKVTTSEELKDLLDSL